MTTSCIIRHFEHYAELSPEDPELLDALEKESRHFPKHSVICQQGNPSDHFYTVRSGWARSYRNVKAGQSMKRATVNFPERSPHVVRN